MQSKSFLVYGKTGEFAWCVNSEKTNVNDQLESSSKKDSNDYRRVFYVQNVKMHPMIYELANNKVRLDVYNRT